MARQQSASENSDTIRIEMPIKWDSPNDISRFNQTILRLVSVVFVTALDYTKVKNKALAATNITQRFVDDLFADDMGWLVSIDRIPSCIDVRMDQGAYSSIDVRGWHDEATQHAWPDIMVIWSGEADDRDPKIAHLKRKSLNYWGKRIALVYNIDRNRQFLYSTSDNTSEFLNKEKMNKDNIEKFHKNQKAEKGSLRRQKSKLKDASKRADHEVNRTDTKIEATIRSSVRSAFEETAKQREITQKAALEAALDMWIKSPAVEAPPTRAARGSVRKNDPFVHFQVRVDKSVSDAFSKAVAARGFSTAAALRQAIENWAAPEEKFGRARRI